MPKVTELVRNTPRLATQVCLIPEIKSGDFTLRKGCFLLLLHLGLPTNSPIALSSTPRIFNHPSHLSMHKLPYFCWQKSTYIITSLQSWKVPEGCGRSLETDRWAGRLTDSPKTPRVSRQAPTLLPANQSPYWLYQDPEFLRQPLSM